MPEGCRSRSLAALATHPLKNSCGGPYRVWDESVATAGLIAFGGPTRAWRSPREWSNGFGPIWSAVAADDAALRDADDSEAAIETVVRRHLVLGAVGRFVTGVGGDATCPSRSR